MTNYLAAKQAFEFNPVLDTHYMHSIYQGDAENAHYIFELYLTELPDTLERIRAAQQQNNLNALFEVIHKTKTSFSFVGLSHITVIMEAIEKKCASVAHVFQLAGDLETLQEEIYKFKPVIEEEFARLSASVKQIA